MYDSNSKGISYTAGFFILIGFVIAGILLAGVISIPVWTSMTGTSFEKISTEMDNPAYANAFKVIQIITAMVGFFFPAVLTAFLLNRKPMKLIGFAGTPKGMQLFLVLLIVFFGLLVSTGLSYLNSHFPIPTNWRISFDKMENDYNSGVESIISLKSFSDFLIALFILAVLPAVCEETLFRGGLQNFLTRSTKMPWLSVIIVSILFSLAHWSYYGFLSRLFLGIMLGLLYQYSGKIWLNIFGHFLNNGIAITVLYVSTLNGKSMKDAMNENSDNFWGILALPIVIALFVWFYNISRKDKERLEPIPPVQNTSENLFS
ncbi:MAG TPA: CPBP family intramembrane glutamic endopeptidase [Chitinophagaceae bacterium]|nr:CPBP family intramembrane glutamic endopeptidase [Chitinophagaceae bacterium]